MGNKRVIPSEEYYRLLWWTAKGFMDILHGKYENLQETAKKYLDGITTLVNQVEEPESKGLVKKWRKLWGK